MAAVLITCEHGGNRIPPAYRELFQPHRQLLESHRGYDPGTLVLAEKLAKTLDAPLIQSTTSRLLVDLNRSIGHPSLFSIATRPLSQEARSQIIDQYYRPYRDRVENHLRQAAGRRERTIHCSIHSFTPTLDGEIRRADVGFLYDPSRPAERGFVDQWIKELSHADTDLKIRRNYPYRGTADGLTTYLRSILPARYYVGLEIEINQRFPLSDPKGWRRLQGRLIHSLTQSLESKSTH